MFKVIRRHANPATAMAFVAMIFAMSGGAFAASGVLGASGGHGDKAVASAAKKKGKAKSKSTKGPAGPRGAEGKQGPEGKQGSEGKQGPEGKPGANGTDGTNGAKGERGEKGENGESGENGEPGAAGKSVSSETFEGTDEPASKPCKEAGGTSLEIEGSGTPNYVCNGSAAASSKTLKPGETETGMWSTSTAGAAQGGAHGSKVAISFPIALEARPKHFEFLKQGEEETANCPGERAEPEAAPGYLCVYLISAKKAYIVEDSGVGYEVGALWEVLGESESAEGYIFGSWAVTAE